MIVEVEALREHTAHVTVREDADDVNPPATFKLEIFHANGREFQVSLLAGDALDFDRGFPGTDARPLYDDTIEVG